MVPCNNVAWQEQSLIHSLIALPNIYLIFKLYGHITGQGTFQPKKKENLDERQKPKTFKDIGGCDEAKDAI